MPNVRRLGTTQFVLDAEVSVQPMSMTIAINEWDTETRPCRFSLSLQRDSVFADFDTDPNGHVFLRRISFDGYGCCTTDGTCTKMNKDDSNELLAAVLSCDVDHERIREILYRYFDENKQAIWQDALVEHELLA